MRIYFDTIGCRLNQAEIEHLAAQFKSAGHSLVGSSKEADLVVINTCAVTSAAASDSRERVRQAYHAGAKQIILTGCWATIEPGAAAMLPGVMRVVTNQNKETLVSDVLGIPLDEFEIDPISREPLPGLHHRTRAFIKVQDGCDNFCTFCITRIARGAGVSVPLNAVIHEISLAVQGGVKEVVLSGVHLGAWGRDLKNGNHLKDLLQAILDQTDVQRVRLSSIEPWGLDQSFFDLWQDSRMCRHIHFPLQSGSRSVLKRMARNNTPETYRALTAMARTSIPDLALTTDIIVGFPMESEAEFEESLEFASEMHFAGGHVFKYSARPGTAAAKLGGRVNGKIAHDRSQKMRSLLRQSSQEFESHFVGKSLDVLWESSSAVSRQGWRMHGLTGNYLKVAGWMPEDHWNQIDQVKALTLCEDHLEVELIQD